MPDEIGKEATRSDAPSADESSFANATDDAPATIVEEEDANGNATQVPQGSDDVGDKPDADAKANAQEDLKVVVSIKGGWATIGVQRPSADPHVESFDDADLSGLAQEVPAVTERARAKWQETPKHPAYARPAPPARRRNRRRRGASQNSNAEGEAERQQAQTPRLF